MNYILYVSAEVMDVIKEMPMAIDAALRPAAVQIILDQRLPLNLVYDACDLETKRECKIPSGEWVHMLRIPKVDPESYNVFRSISRYT